MRRIALLIVCGVVLANAGCASQQQAAGAPAAKPWYQLSWRKPAASPELKVTDIRDMNTMNQVGAPAAGGTMAATPGMANTGAGMAAAGQHQQY